MSRNERDFAGRSAEERGWMLQNTWCDACGEADLGMNSPRAVSLILVTTASGVKDQAAHIDYDTFMKGDLDSRISTFQVITSDNKAEIVRTQLDRWLTANRDRLTAEQMALLAENRAFIAAALYEQPRSEAILARAKDLESRSLAVLSREDVGQALTIHGMYIPKP